MNTAGQTTCPSIGCKRRLRVLITAGPTREPIDPVRFISNYSTGYMGARLAAEALRRGHQATVISGPVTEPYPQAAYVVPVSKAHELERALRRRAPGADVIVMAAAVADFQPARAAAVKLPRRAAVTLKLRATPDIIARLPRRPQQVVAGFAVETGPSAVSRAQRKLREKRLDVLLAQQAGPSADAGGRAGAPFGRRKVRAWLLDRSGAVEDLGSLSKQDVARVLLDKVEALWYGQRRLAALTKAADGATTTA